MANNVDEAINNLLEQGYQGPVPSSPVPPSPVEEQGLLSKAAEGMAQRQEQSFDFLSDINPFTLKDVAEIAGETSAVAVAAKGLQKVPNPLARGAGYALAAGAGASGGVALYTIAKDEPLDHMELLKVAAMSAGLSAGSDLAFKAGAKVIDKIRSGKPLSEADRAAFEEANEALLNSRVKIVPTGSGFEVRTFADGETIPEDAIPVSMRPDQIVGGFETLKAKIGKSSLRGEAYFEAVEEAQNKAFQDIWEQTQMAYGGVDQVSFGQLVKITQDKLRDYTIDVTEPMFKQVDELAGSTVINMDSVYTAARDRLSQAGANIRSNFAQKKDGTFVLKTKKGEEYKLNTNLPSEIDAVMKKLADRVDTSVPFSEVMNDIKMISGVIDELPMGSGVRRDLEKIRNDIYDSLDNQASNLGSEVLDTWRVAKDLYRNGVEGVAKDGFTDVGGKVLLSALEGNASQVAKTFIDEGEIGVRSLKTFMDNAERHLEQLNKRNLNEGKPALDTEEILGSFKASYMYHTWNRLSGSKTANPQASVLETFNQALGPKGTTGHDPNVRNIATEVFDSDKDFGQFRALLAMGASLEKIMAGNFSLLVRGQQSAGLRSAGSEAIQVATGKGDAGSIFSATLQALRYVIPESFAKAATDPTKAKKILQAMNGLKKSAKDGTWGAEDWTRLAVLIGDNLAPEQEEIINEAFMFSGERPAFQEALLRSALMDEEAAVQKDEPVIPR